MILAKAIELLKVVSTIPIKEQNKYPEIRIFHSIGDDYTLHITTELLTTEFRKQLLKIADSHKLGIRESNNYLIIYSYS
jgi:hypothetical protein